MYIYSLATCRLSSVLAALVISWFCLWLVEAHRQSARMHNSRSYVV